MRRKVRDDVLREIGHASTGDRRPNFHAWDLTDADLTHLHLPNVDFSKANLTGANLHEAILASATYDPAQFLNARGINPYNPRHYTSTHRFDTILPTDPDTQELLRELLQDWEGTLGEAITAAEELRRA